MLPLSFGQTIIIYKLFGFFAVYFHYDANLKKVESYIFLVIVIITVLLQLT